MRGEVLHVFLNNLQNHTGLKFGPIWYFTVPWKHTLLYFLCTMCKKRTNMREVVSVRLSLGPRISSPNLQNRFGINWNVCSEFDSVFISTIQGVVYMKLKSNFVYFHKNGSSFEELVYGIKYVSLMSMVF